MVQVVGLPPTARVRADACSISAPAVTPSEIWADFDRSEQFVLSAPMREAPVDGKRGNWVVMALVAAGLAAAIAGWKWRVFTPAATQPSTTMSATR